MTINFKREFVAVTLWVGMWGLIENIIDMHIPYNNYFARIATFSIITMISLIFLCIEDTTQKKFDD